MTDARPVIVSCYFAARGGGDHWRRMASVLRSTASDYCPGWDQDIREMAAPTAVGGKRAGDTANSAKLSHWTDAVMAAADGQRILLIDTDTAIVRSLDSIWDRSFDLAYTTKRDTFPFNAGVIFLRVSATTRAFMAAWLAENQRLYRDPAAHNRCRMKHGGMNQAALGSLMDQGAAAWRALDVLELPCTEWNCEDSAWAHFDPARTRILHVKGSFRFELLGPSMMRNSARRPAAEFWRSRDRAVMEARA